MRVDLFEASPADAIAAGTARDITSRTEIAALGTRVVCQGIIIKEKENVITQARRLRQRTAGVSLACLYTKSTISNPLALVYATRPQYRDPTDRRRWRW